MSPFIKRLFLRSNLNLLDSAAKILKLSKFIMQLHCNSWSDIADCLTFFGHFPVRLEIPMWSPFVLHVLTELGYVLKCQVKEEKKCSFENALVEKSENSTRNKNGLVEGLIIFSLNVHLHGFVSLHLQQKTEHLKKKWRWQNQSEAEFMEKRQTF